MNTQLPLHWLASLVVPALLLAGCGESGPRAADAPPPAVTVSKPVERQVINFDEYEGRIAPQQSVEVRARVRGHLTRVAFEDGQLVQEGMPLFEIDARNFQLALKAAEAQKSAADAAVELATAEHARVRTLVPKGAASREELDVWIGKRNAASAEQLKAQQAIDQAKLDLEYTRIIAPISGKISRAQASVGNLVNAGGGETLLTTIVSVDPMYIYFDVDERALLRYRKDFRKANQGKDEGKEPRPRIKELKIPVEVALEGDEGYPHRGVIDFADNRVDPGTGTISVRGVLPNKARLLDAGMRARVRIPVSSPYKATLITERAVGNEQGRRFVYVVNKDNTVERRDVALDRVIGGLQVVRGGLAAGDSVIVNGIQRVREGLVVQPKEVPMPDAAPPAAQRPQAPQK